MHNTFGVISHNGSHTDVSLTEKGAKNYATRHGYTKVSIRLNGSMHVRVIAEKKPNGKWSKPDSQ